MNASRLQNHFILSVILTISFFINISSQTFTKITSPESPLVSDSLPPGYIGTAWIDFNNDGSLDLFVNNDYLYKNEGSSGFSKNLEFKGRTQSIMPGVNISSGSSWADYDNDGDIDMFSTSAKSFLFQNNNDETFTRISSGTLSDSTGIRGWSCAWGDYDNDGNVDLLVVHAANFTPGGAIPNLLFHNDGPPDYNFTKVDFEFTLNLAPYTVATWSDFDMDGDIDLFFASGPGGTTARDFIYKNMLKENGSVSFQRITEAPLGTDLQNGQVYNIIDYDNDNDLDIFLTNYQQAVNRLYRNDNGIYTLISNAMTLNGIACLANTWGDFDNDGYLDVVITSESSNYYYHNNKDGTFTSVSNSISLQTGAARGATVGDYDNDGDLDVCIVGRLNVPGASSGQGLFRNDNTNGNWKKFKLEGTESNRSAIGAMVRLKASIDGTPMWLTREVAAQNSFNSQNSLDVHFGLGSASIIDSVIIFWPSGVMQVLVNLPINTFETITEPLSTGIDDDISAPEGFQLQQNYPNPFNPETKINYSIAEDNFVTIDIYNSLGELIHSLVNGFHNAGSYSISFNTSDKKDQIPSGVYFYKMRAGNFLEIKKMIVLK